MPAGCGRTSVVEIERADGVGVVARDPPVAECVVVDEQPATPTATAAATATGPPKGRTTSVSRATGLAGCLVEWLRKPALTTGR